MEAVRAKDGTLIACWAHRKNGWRWSDDCQCWYQATFDQPPTAYCLGERYIHAEYGLDSYGIVWAGSFADNWHGYQPGADLTRAIGWVRSCQYPELGFAVWGIK